ncbi:MAG TPA: substrate-binding domain-containing protein [Anaerolineales bacterium]|nr:substrate-binding domain-containing protein [Anaerolineales bacterium]
MKRFSILFALLLALAFSGTVVAEDYHFVLVNNRTTLTNFNPDYDGAQLACDELNAWTDDKVTWEIVGPTEMNLVAEAQAMEAAIAKGPDGFMVICWDAKTMTPPINKAMDAGIPVVTIDADAPDSKRLCYIGTDWYTLGVELGTALAKEINYKGKVAMLGLVGADNMETAFRGFADTVGKWPAIKIIAKEHDNSNKAEAARIATALMQKHPDLAGFAGFDSESGPGIARAVKEAGKAGKVKVVGNDLNADQIQYLKDGTEQFVLGQKRIFFGYWGVMMLYLHVKSNLAFTEADKAIGVTNIPPRVVTGFLRASKEGVDAYKKAFDKWSQPRR